MKYLGLILLTLGLSACTTFSSQQKPPMDTNTNIPKNASIATFAGGCFWCIEQAFQGQEGVYEAISGYAGGDESDASYKLVSQDDTGHRESAQVYYNPEIISYQDLLTIFWRQIDPTDDGGQFADRGFHYTTAIYFHNDEQEKLAEASLEKLENSDKYEAPIVTEIIPYTTFFPAEEEHQNFAQKRSAYYQLYKKGSGRKGYIDQKWGEGPEE